MAAVAGDDNGEVWVSGLVCVLPPFSEVFRSDMHALILAVDADHYRPGTPPASRSPTPPRKRQRVDNKHSGVPKGVLRLLDLEAREDSDTEDDDDDVQEAAGAFIDDEPNHELPVPYELPFHDAHRAAVRDDAEFLRGLAASFEEEARNEREQVRREREGHDDVSHIPPM